MFRVSLDDVEVSGGLFTHGDRGDGQLELVQDAGTEGVVDPGDVVRVREYDDGKNLRAQDNGRMMWINVMVVLPDQRTSDALTRSWGTVWSTPWQVGG